MSYVERNAIGMGPEAQREEHLGLFNKEHMLYDIVMYV